MKKKEGKAFEEGIAGEIMPDDVEKEEEGQHQPDQLAALSQLNALYADKIKSQAAEFENFRNRTTKEMARMYDNGVRDFVLELLPVIDNFALALKSADTSGGLGAGVLMIQNQLFATLEKLGVVKIETVGKIFDTKFHDAVSHIKDDSLGENVVAQELQGGYIYKDVVIRHAVVVVAN